MALAHLDFAIVDDLALATRAKGLTALTAQMDVAQIGPVLEYWSLRQEPGSHLPTIEFERRITDSLASSASRLTLTPSSLEFTAPGHEADAEQPPHWTAFRMRAQKAAERAGFSSQSAKAFVGSLDEMTDNALRHSEHPQTAVVGYRWTPGEFEYVIADRGIGVLRSLATNPEYSCLSDHGTALQLAVKDGASRFSDPRHGTGFRQVFKSLAAMKGSLRFRSGDHSLDWNGCGPTPNDISLAQRANLQGFLVSVRVHLS